MELFIFIFVFFFSSMRFDLDGMDRVLLSLEVLLGLNKRSLIYFMNNSIKAGVAGVGDLAQW